MMLRNSGGGRGTGKRPAAGRGRAAPTAGVEGTRGKGGGGESGGGKERPAAVGGASVMTPMSPNIRRAMRLRHYRRVEAPVLVVVKGEVETEKVLVLVVVQQLLEVGVTRVVVVLVVRAEVVVVLLVVEKVPMPLVLLPS